MKLLYHVKGWDGKDIDFLVTTYEHYSSETGFHQDLLESLALTDRHQSAASWMFRRSLQRGYKPKPEEAAFVYQALAACTSWEAQLNLLQCIELLEVPESARPSLEQFLRKALSHDNKFVRAWAYNGFYQLARQYPELRDESLQIMEMGSRDEPASVKARIRNALKNPY
jgi:hypothetical protein